MVTWSRPSTASSSAADRIAERDLTLNVNEWRGEIWGVCSGAGIQKGYVVGTRSGDELRLGVSVLQDDGNGDRRHGRAAGSWAPTARPDPVWSSTGSSVRAGWSAPGWTDPDARS